MLSRFFYFKDCFFSFQLDFFFDVMLIIFLSLSFNVLKCNFFIFSHIDFRCFNSKNGLIRTRNKDINILFRLISTLITILSDLENTIIWVINLTRSLLFDRTFLNRFWFFFNVFSKIGLQRVIVLVR